jgi:uncharacterized membrane protein
MLTNYLAELWGISLIIIPLALLINQRYLKKMFETVEDDKTLFCWGIMALIIGLAMVLAHNVWVKDWQVIITILGWISLIKGLAILITPSHIKNMTRKLENAPFLPVALFMAVLIGLVITYFGFTA